MGSVGRPTNDENVSRPPPVGVPRRFGLGSLFVLTTFSSGAFFLAQAIQMPREVVAMIGVFFVIIGAAQWIIGEGRRARWVSVIAGSILFGIFELAVAVVSIRQTLFIEGPNSVPVTIDLFNILLSLPIALLMGGMLGYLVGTLAAGVFLISHMADDWIARRLRARAEGTTGSMVVKE